MRAGGIGAAVAVDMQCARAVVAGGLRLGHLGHLVQVPGHEAGEAAGMTPDFWTVFSRDKAAEAELLAGLPFSEINLVNQSDFDVLVDTIFATDRHSVPKGMVEVAL